MPLINITTWPTPDDKKKAMLEAVTRAVHETTGAPLDKITVFIHEIEQKNWAEAGVLGNDETFPVKSRRKTYNEESL